jgi:hypothetical protein
VYGARHAALITQRLDRPLRRSQAHEKNISDASTAFVALRRRDQA